MTPPVATRTSVIINLHYRLLTPLTIWTTLLSQWATILSYRMPRYRDRPMGTPKITITQACPFPPVPVDLHSHESK